MSAPTGTAPANSSRAAIERPRRLTILALSGAGAVVIAAVIWGRRLAADGVHIYLSAPPFSGSWAWQWPPGLWWALGLAAVLAVAWPTTARRLSWWWLLVATWATAASWAVTLAGSAGIGALEAPLTTRYEYLPFARAAGSPRALLQTFVDRLASAPTHVRGHPPGAVLTFMGLDRLGASDLTVALVVIAVGASAAPAALIAMDRVAGRPAARRAAVFVGLAPAALWIATSVDALFAGVAAWAIAAGAVAVTSDDRRLAPLAGATSGVLAGSLLTMTYGAPTLLGPLWALAGWALISRRSIAPLVAGAVGVALPVVALWTAGFDWPGAFAATHDAYRSGVASERPGTYFLVANVAVFAVAAGPAAVAGATHLRDRRTWLLVGGAIGGALVADLSGLSKGEVERIWLPMVAFSLLATSAIRGIGVRRGWLTAQLGLAIVLQAWLRSPW